MLFDTLCANLAAGFAMVIVLLSGGVCERRDTAHSWGHEWKWFEATASAFVENESLRNHYSVHVEFQTQRESPAEAVANRA